MSRCELPCPECDGAGFYGGNGPVVHSLCAFCHGTGVHEPAEEIAPMPAGRAYQSAFSDPLQRKATDKIFAELMERQDRQGFGS